MPRSFFLLRSTRRNLGLFAVLAGCACSGPPPVDEQLDTLRSWTATATLAARQRAQGAINAAVVTQLLGRGRQALDDARGQLPHDRVSAGVLDSLRSALSTLNAANRP